MSVKMYLQSNRGMTAYELFQKAWEWQYKVPLNTHGNARLLQDLADWRGRNRTPPYVSDYLGHLLTPAATLPARAF